VAVFKVYRPQSWFGWLLVLVGLSNLTFVGADTSLAFVIGSWMLLVIGAKIISMMSGLPVSSVLPVSESVSGLDLFSFIQLFAGVWGHVLGASILQNQLGKHLPADFIQNLPNGGSGVGLTFSTIPLIRTLPEPLKTQVREAFGESLRVVWKALFALAVIGLMASVLVKEVPMRGLVNGKWVLEGENASSDGETMKEMGLGEKMSDVAKMDKSSDAPA